MQQFSRKISYRFSVRIQNPYIYQMVFQQTQKKRKKNHTLENERRMHDDKIYIYVYSQICSASVCKLYSRSLSYFLNDRYTYQKISSDYND